MSISAKSRVDKTQKVPVPHIQSHLKQFLKSGSPNLLKQLETNNLRTKPLPLIIPHTRDRVPQMRDPPAPTLNP
jgi:hypothetical protein